MPAMVKMGGMPPRTPVNTSTYLGRVAKRLTTLREGAGLSVPKLAERLTKAGYSVKEPTIYSWEQGRSSPHLEALPALAKVFRLTAPGDVLPKR